MRAPPNSEGASIKVMKNRKLAGLPAGDATTTEGTYFRYLCATLSARDLLSIVKGLLDLVEGGNIKAPPPPRGRAATPAPPRGAARAGRWGSL